jgi:hypothetical protein
MVGGQDDAHAAFSEDLGDLVLAEDDGADVEGFQACAPVEMVGGPGARGGSCRGHCHSTTRVTMGLFGQVSSCRARPAKYLASRTSSSRSAEAGVFQASRLVAEAGCVMARIRRLEVVQGMLLEVTATVAAALPGTYQYSMSRSRKSGCRLSSSFPALTASVARLFTTKFLTELSSKFFALLRNSRKASISPGLSSTCFAW